MTDLGPVVVVREPGRTPLYVIVREPLDIGRDCPGLLLDDPQTSRSHARLKYERGDLFIEDLGSTNGTTVDGTEITEPTRLWPGRIARLGSTTVEVVAVGASNVSVPPPSGSMRVVIRTTAERIDGADERWMRAR